MTGGRKGPGHAANKNVSHVTENSVDAGEIVGTAWDALRVALRIPDGDRQEGEQYTTASGQLFDFIGEQVRRAATEGAAEELIQFRDAARAVSEGVRAASNTLTVNHFSKEISRWKSGESAAKGADVEQERRGTRQLLSVPSRPYRVLFDIRSPRETDAKQSLERPASVRWSIELEGVAIAPVPAGKRTTAEAPDERYEGALKGSPILEGTNIENPALFSAGVEDAMRGVARIDQSSADPVVRKTTRQVNRLLWKLRRLGVALLILAIPYIGVPRVRAEVNAAIKVAVDYWFRLTTRGGSHLTVHRFSGEPVYRPDPAWLAAGEPLAIRHALDWPFDDAQRVTLFKESIKLAGGDPGMVLAQQLRWRGGVEGSVVRDVSTGPGIVRLLIVPSPSNRYTSLTYVITTNEITPKTLQLRSMSTIHVDEPHVGVQDLVKNDFGYVITITMIPTALLQGGQKSIAADCEFVELFIENDANGRLTGFAPPAAAGGIEFRPF